MSWRRLGLVAALDLREAGRRPVLWFWAAVMAGNAWLMSRDNWIYRSVDTSLGSPRAWANSEFQTAFVMPLLAFLLTVFFVVVVSGLPLIRDGENRVREILGATPLRPVEYVWGKFAAALAGCLAVLALFLAALLVFSYLLPDVSHPEIYGPFTVGAWLRPFLLLMLPGLVFMAGAAFLLGAWSDRPIVVFLLPVVLLPFLQNFVWRWFPETPHPVATVALRYLDPSGFRWLKETWLRVDRGIEFYNTHPVSYDAPFVASRVAFVAAGLLLVATAAAVASRRRRGAAPARRASRASSAPRAQTAAAGSARLATGAAGSARPVTGAAGSAQPMTGATGSARPLAALSMRSRPPGWANAALAVARFELAELRAQPGLYVFLPAILLFLLIDWNDASGPFNTSDLLTPGTAATRSLLVLMPWLCALLLFYTVESLARERTVALAPIYYATPAPSSALVAGKALANLAIVGATLAVAFAGAAWTMAEQGAVHPAIGPFLLVWGLLLLPTMVLWIAFVAAVHALTGDRHVTYGVGLLALVATYAFQLRGVMNWVGNWLLIGAVRWSDLGTFELDRKALWLNRLGALALVPLLAWAAVGRFRRREADPLASAARRPGVRRRAAAIGGLLALPPMALALALYVAVEQGFQGGVAKELHKDYWRQNLATWLDAPLPYVTHVEADVELDPARRWFRVAGSYDLVNRRGEELPWYPITGGIGWRGLSWTLDGRPYQPQEREPRNGLFVVDRPLPPGGTQRLGFRYEGALLPGVSRDGGEVALGEFILPSGVLVTARNPDFVPVVGFRPGVGVDDENRFEPKRFAADFWRHPLDAEIDRSAFTSRIRITAPAEYTVNSTGVLAGVAATAGGRRTWRWQSDYPLRVWNIAAGRWAVRQGRNGTAVYYNPAHPWNVDSMLAALDGARRWYAEWFGPYPWRDLRLNEFPGVATYARGNATNIFYSEAAGFLSQPGQVPDVAFSITAHEAAHQWWGHILAAGEGPGGIILAEGAANFSTMLLLDQERGGASRIAFATRSEAAYGETRQPSTEKPLAETTPFRPADETVIYDKGGWAFWMLLQQMGRNAFFAGARHFIAQYHDAPGHPVLQHFVAAMRPFAPDPRGFDEVVRQWFFGLSVPEYHIDGASKRPLPGGNAGGGGGSGGGGSRGEWEVMARVTNAGSGRMPVEVAAASQRDRFTEDGRPAAGYRDVRLTLVLGPGQAKDVRLRCPFEPHRLVVDPDVNVLQLQRRAAAVRL